MKPEWLHRVPKTRRGEHMGSLWAFDRPFRLCKALLLVLNVVVFCCTCAPEFSIYNSKVPASQRSRNERELVRLAASQVSKLASGTMRLEMFKFGVVADTHSDYRDFSKVVALPNKRDDLDFVVLLVDTSFRQAMFFELNMHEIALLATFTNSFFIPAQKLFTYTVGYRIDIAR